MQINRLYIWVCFLFCLALTAGGILILFRDKKYKQIRALQFLQYYSILIYTFGFYSMWSNIFFRIFFDSVQTNTITSIASYLSLIGTPFLLIGLLMFILWVANLLEKKPETFLLSGGLLIVLLIVLVYLAYKRFDLLLNVNQAYALLVLTIMIFASLLLTFSKTKYLERNTKSILITLVAFSGAIHLPLFLNLLEAAFSELAFIFLFYLSNTSICVYFAYNVKPKPIVVIEERLESLSLESFIRKFGITARESEVALEIYKGKTNQEIADNLFVTIQTIKDHTHRIYQKTNVKNRTQLASLLRKFGHPNEEKTIAVNKK